MPFCYYQICLRVTIWPSVFNAYHYNDVIMSAIASQITSLTIVYSSSASLAFVRGIHRWYSPHKGPVTRKMSPFDDAIMFYTTNGCEIYLWSMMTYIRVRKLGHHLFIYWQHPAIATQRKLIANWTYINALKDQMPAPLKRFPSNFKFDWNTFVYISSLTSTTEKFCTLTNTYNEWNRGETYVWFAFWQQIYQR